MRHDYNFGYNLIHVRCGTMTYKLQLFVSLTKDMVPIH